MPIEKSDSYLLYPLDSTADFMCPKCGASMKLAAREQSEVEPNFVTYRCQTCDHTEKYISDEAGP